MQPRRLRPDPLARPNSPLALPSITSKLRIEKIYIDTVSIYNFFINLELKNQLLNQY